MHLRWTRSMDMRSSWWITVMVGLIGGILLMLAVGLATGCTQFKRDGVPVVVVHQPAVSAPLGKDLVVPDANLGVPVPQSRPSIDSGHGGLTSGIITRQIAQGPPSVFGPIP